MEEIEEIQAEQEREQFYHDQEQEMKIQEKEEEHERNVEHNLALIHQVWTTHLSPEFLPSIFLSLSVDRWLI